MMSDQASIDRIPNRSSMLVFAPPAAIKHSFSASDSFDARLRYSAKRFPFFGLEPTGCAVSGISGMKMVWRTAAGCGAAAEEGDPEAGPADTVSVKPNDFLEAPWNGSRILTQSAGRLVSGEKSAAAWALHTPLAVVSSTKLATSV